MSEPVDTARGQNPAPSNPKRVWDEARGLWQEAFTVCRNTRGEFERKIGNELESQLALPFNQRGAA